MSEKNTNNTTTRAVGRRKTAAARVKIAPGKGMISINGRELMDYFPVAIWQQKIRMPLELTNRDKNMDISVKVAGGGIHGQAEAVRHGIARALVIWDETLKPLLKAHGLLTRDPRAKERKKFGLHKARRGHQWRKR
jgi:small subunit ribosomal protein S9